jgi:hypothetical protein
LFVLTVMRKLEARLASDGAGNVTQLTRAQKMIAFSFTLNSVGLFVAPDSKVLAVVEVTCLLCLLAEGWVHFAAFGNTTNATFGQVGNVVARNTSTLLKRARNAKKHVGRTVQGMFLMCHIVVGVGMLYNPLLNAFPPECQVFAFHTTLDPTRLWISMLLQFEIV